METVRYCGNTYFFNILEHDCYYYEKGDYTNVITFKGRNYVGHEFKLEYRILGPRDILLTKRMISKGVLPWDVIDIGPSKLWSTELEPAI